MGRQQRLGNVPDIVKNNLEQTAVLAHGKNSQRKNLEFKYQGISINNIQQLKYIQDLLNPKLIQHYSNSNLSIKLKGIVVLAQNKKVGLILADISQNNRVAEVISLVTPNRFERQIETKLIRCLEQCLPKINCDRLIFKI